MMIFNYNISFIFKKFFIGLFIIIIFIFFLSSIFVECINCDDYDNKQKVVLFNYDFVQLKNKTEIKSFESWYDIGFIFYRTNITTYVKPFLGNYYDILCETPYISSLFFISFFCILGFIAIKIHLPLFVVYKIMWGTNEINKSNNTDLKLDNFKLDVGSVINENILDNLNAIAHLRIKQSFVLKNDGKSIEEVNSKILLDVQNDMELAAKNVNWCGGMVLKSNLVVLQNNIFDYSLPDKFNHYILLSVKEPYPVRGIEVLDFFMYLYNNNGLHFVEQVHIYFYQLNVEYALVYLDYLECNHKIPTELLQLVNWKNFNFYEKTQLLDFYHARFSVVDGFNASDMNFFASLVKRLDFDVELRVNATLALINSQNVIDTKLNNIMEFDYFSIQYYICDILLFNIFFFLYNLLFFSIFLCVICLKIYSFYEYLLYIYYTKLDSSIFYDCTDNNNIFY